MSSSLQSSAPTHREVTVQVESFLFFACLLCSKKICALTDCAGVRRAVRGMERQPVLADMRQPVLTEVRAAQRLLLHAETVFLASDHPGVSPLLTWRSRLQTLMQRIEAGGPLLRRLEAAEAAAGGVGKQVQLAVTALGTCMDLTYISIFALFLCTSASGHPASS